MSSEATLSQRRARASEQAQDQQNRGGVRDDQGAEDGPREVAEQVGQQLPGIRANAANQRQHCLLRESISSRARSAAGTPPRARRRGHLGSDVWEPLEGAIDEFTRIRDQVHDRIPDGRIHGDGSTDGLRNVLLGARVGEN